MKDNPVGTVSKYNRKIEERGKIDAHSTHMHATFLA
jgi:hypothetical protein